MTYTPQHVANYFLNRADEEGLPISPLKLLKLVYIAYGWNLALTGERLYEEPIQAWKHGPVIPSLYHEFKHFRSNPIDERSMRFDMDTGDTFFPVIPTSDKNTNLILDKVWAAYKNLSGWALRAKTHEADTPWSKVYKPGELSIELNDDDIKAHYKERIGRYIEAVT